MESEELLAQKKLRTEVIQLEDMLAQVRKEYEMLRIEFEQNLAANEQTGRESTIYIPRPSFTLSLSSGGWLTGPINKEMRNLITSLQSHNVQLKGEVARYKRKGKEAQLEIAKLRKDLDEMKTQEIKALQVRYDLEAHPSIHREKIGRFSSSSSASASSSSYFSTFLFSARQENI